MPPGRRRDCIELLQRMAIEDDLMRQHMALRKLIPLLGPHASAPWRERLRQLLWLQGVGLRGAGLSSGTLADYWKRGEVAAWQARAQELGRWPPPPDWLPRDERSRRLILGH
jgi:hypothetical protein